MQDLADEIDMSTSFVAHHFPSEFGKSARDYIWDQKMRAARSELEGGALVQDVADALGFFDAFHFSKRFKAFWGFPPSHCRPTNPD